MSWQYYIDARAQLEYETSFLWYDERSFSAGSNFIEAVEYCIKTICNDPFFK